MSSHKKTDPGQGKSGRKKRKVDQMTPQQPDEPKEGGKSKRKSQSAKSSESSDSQQAEPASVGGARALPKNLTPTHQESSSHLTTPGGSSHALDSCDETKFLVEVCFGDEAPRNRNFDPQAAENAVHNLHQSRDSRDETQPLSVVRLDEEKVLNHQIFGPRVVKEVVHDIHQFEGLDEPKEGGESKRKLQSAKYSKSSDSQQAEQASLGGARALPTNSTPALQGTRPDPATPGGSSHALDSCDEIKFLVEVCFGDEEVPNNQDFEPQATENVAHDLPESRVSDSRNETPPLFVVHLDEEKVLNHQKFDPKVVKNVVNNIIQHEGLVKKLFGEVVPEQTKSQHDRHFYNTPTWEKMTVKDLVAFVKMKYWLSSSRLNESISYLRHLAATGKKSNPSKLFIIEPKEFTPEEIKSRFKKLDAWRMQTVNCAPDALRMEILDPMTDKLKKTRAEIIYWYRIYREEHRRKNKSQDAADQHQGSSTVADKQTQA